MTRLKNILAIDSAMSGAGVAVLSENGQVVVRQDERLRGQAEYLMPMVQSAMEEAALEFEQLDAIVTSVGPGAFTGLRIGLAAAKALGLALSVPVFGITSLQALALSVMEQVSGDVTVLVETRRYDFYVQRFDKDAQALSEAAAMDVSDIEAIIGGDDVLVGDAVERFRELVQGDYDHVLGVKMPDPAVMARGLLNTFELYSEDTQPVYLRGADVSQSKKAYRTLASL